MLRVHDSEFNIFSIHGHINANCPNIPTGSTRKDKNFMGKSYGELNDYFLDQKDRLMQRGVQVDVMWECQWRRIIDNKNHATSTTTSKIIERLLHDGMYDRPKSRLIPRTALRGGRVDAFNLFWSADGQSSHIMEYLDYNSLYVLPCLF